MRAHPHTAPIDTQTCMYIYPHKNGKFSGTAKQSLLMWLCSQTSSGLFWLTSGVHVHLSLLRISFSERRSLSKSLDQSVLAFTRTLIWAALCHATPTTTVNKGPGKSTVLCHKTPIVCRQGHAKDLDLHDNRAGLKDLPGKSFLGFQDLEELAICLCLSHGCCRLVKICASLFALAARKL